MPPTPEFSEKLDVERSSYSISAGEILSSFGTQAALAYQASLVRFAHQYFQVRWLVRTVNERLVELIERKFKNCIVIEV